MKDDTKEKLIVVLECIFATITLCIAPFLIKSCSSEQAIKNVEKLEAKVSGNGITIENPSTTWTIYAQPFNVKNHQDNSFLDNKKPIINNDYDLFGLGVNNYFRFNHRTEYEPKISSIYNSCYSLEFYIEINGVGFSYELGYYAVYDGGDEFGEYIEYRFIKYEDFINVGIYVDYYALNLSYYKNTKLNIFQHYSDNNEIGNIFGDNDKFRLPNNFFGVNENRFKFINLSKENNENSYYIGYNIGYDDGYNNGYNTGFNQAQSTDNVFSILKKGVNAINDLLNIEVLPNVSLWLLMSIPLSISMMVIMFKLLRGD